MAAKRQRKSGAKRPRRLSARFVERVEARLETKPGAVLDSLGQVRKLIADLTDERQRMAKDPKASGRARAEVLRGLSTATRLMAQLDGSASKEPTTAAILRSTQWREVMRRAITALAPFDGAYEALATALEQ